MATINLQQYIPDSAQMEQYGNVVAFEVPTSEIVALVTDWYANQHLSLKLIDATDETADGDGFKVWYVFGVPGAAKFLAAYIRIGKDGQFPSLAGAVHEAGAYEKKIRTFFGLNPVGYPDPRPALLHENWPTTLHPLRKGFAGTMRPKDAHGTYKMQVVEGEGIYEIPVGPIHAGIIGPGHFRFSVAGEEIILLDPKLGWSHRGVEKLFEGFELADQIRLSEKVSGDSSFGHSLAFCQAVEALGGIAVPERAKFLRVIYAELERLANHFGDIGFIMLDTGFNFGGSQGARLREAIMQINGRLTGSRFLRGVNVVGGVARDITKDERLDLPREPRMAKDFTELIEIAESSISVLNRLKGTGRLPRDIAEDHGVVGVGARAVGLAADVRADHPYAAYGELGPIDVAVEQSGDVYARFRVRVKEVIASLELIRGAVAALPEGEIVSRHADKPLAKSAVAIGLVEGWRGEIAYFVRTDAKGAISRVAVRDPSAANWQAVPYCAPGMMVPDFPLINKSFNLSYSGNDL